MDSADIVYCPPELDGEAKDKNFKRYRQGLGITNINIYPHWNPDLIDQEFLDGQNIFKDIMLEDSKTKPFVAFDDGTYILVSPLLLEEEVKQLKEAFSHIEKKKRQKNTYNSNNEWMLEDTYEETMHFMEQINQLLDRFFIQELDNPNTVNASFQF